MKKTAFVFPGQGVQYVGMGKDFYQNYNESRAVFDAASQATGIDIAELCFYDSNDRINTTSFTQIALITTELAILAHVEAMGLRADVCAGLSLGEYGALALARAMRYEDLFRVIKKRGELMQDAMPTGGAMMAIIGMDASVIEQVCAQAAGLVSIANYNSPTQNVISGEKDAVNAAAQTLKELGAKRCLPLNVSGPFHTSLLANAAAELSAELDSIQVQPIQVPYVANYTAEYVLDSAEIKENLVKQICSSVKWQQSVERMRSDGVELFIEIGPGTSLSKLIKKIDATIQTVNIETTEDLKKLEKKDERFYNGKEQPPRTVGKES